MLKLHLLLISFFTVILFSCINLLDDEPANSAFYQYIDSTSNLRLSINFRKYIEHDGEESNYIIIYPSDSASDPCMISDGYISINGTKLEELQTPIFNTPFYSCEDINISCDSSYVIELMFSDSSINSKLLKFPSDNITVFSAPKISSIADSITVSWQNSVPNGRTYIYSTVGYDESGSRSRESDDLDSLNSYTFPENYHTSETFKNDTLAPIGLVLTLKTSWVTPMSFDFSDRGQVVVQYEIEKKVWSKD